MLLAWAALLWVFLRAPDGVGSRRLWIWAVLFRLAGLFAAPIFEDDWHRYLWDGWVFAEEGNPYSRAPAAYFSDVAVPERFQRILDNINNPDVPTIYGPMCQYLFLLAYWVAPGQLWPIKVLLIAADLLAIVFLLRLTSIRNALLYAWCPLVIQETAFNAHPEVLGVCAVVAAIYFFRKHQALGAPAALAFAVAARIHGILIVPFLLAQQKAAEHRRTPRPAEVAKRPGVRRCSAAFLQIAFFLAVVGLLYLPFWLQGSVADWHGLRVFLKHWEFNSMFYAVFASALGSQLTKLVCAAIFAAFYFWYLRTFVIRHSSFEIPRGDWLYGLFFLLSAVINPWYVLWLVPFVSLFPSITGITACIVVSWSYIHGLNWEAAGLPPYHHPWWVRPAEITAVALAFAADLWLRFRPNRKRG